MKKRYVLSLTKDLLPDCAATGQSHMKKVEILTGKRNSIFSEAHIALADHINNKPVIDTERLILRSMTASDLDFSK